MMMEQSAPTQGRARCPVCGVDIAGESCACPGCQTLYHPDCWSWLDGCAIYGCARQAREQAPDPAHGAVVPSPPELPEPAGAGDLVVDTALQQEAASSRSPLPSQVRAYYFAFFALLFPIQPIFAIVLAGLPFMLTRIRWKIDPATDRVEGTVSIAGIPVHRRVIPLHEVVRLEVREDGRVPGLTLVLQDGSHVPLTHDVEAKRKVARRLLGVARGVAVHTHAHLTTTLRRDPVTLRKRLESLKALAALNAGRLDRAAATAYAALPLMAIAALLGMPLWTGAASLVMMILGGGCAAALHYRYESLPLRKQLKDGWITERGVDRAETALRDRFPTPTGFWVGVGGHLSLILVTFLLVGMRSQFAVLALIWSAFGAALSAVDWAHAQNVQRRLLGAELSEPTPAPAGPPLIEGAKEPRSGQA